MDLRKLSTEDLIALQDNDLSRVSTEGLKYIQSQLNPPKQAGFTESFKEAFTTLGAAPEAAKFATAKTPEEKAEARRALLAETESPYETTSWADVKDLPSAIDWASQVAGGSAGFIAAPALAATGAGLATAGVGALPAGAATAVSQYTTTNLIRQAEEQQAAIERGEAPRDTSVAGAVGAAAASTGLDYLGLRFFSPILSKIPFVKNLLGQAGKETAEESAQAVVEAVRSGKYTIKNGVLKGVALGTVIEVPQEIAQSLLERAQAGLSLADGEAWSEYKEAAAGAVLLGSTLGAGQGLMQNRAKRQQAEDILQKAKDEKAAKEAAALTEQEAKLKKEKEEKRAKTAAESEDEVVRKKAQLDAGVDVVQKLGSETTENALRDELRAQLGINLPEAEALLRRLESAKVVSKRNKDTGLRELLEGTVETGNFAEELKGGAGAGVSAVTPEAAEEDAKANEILAKGAGQPPPAATATATATATGPTGAESAAAVGAPAVDTAAAAEKAAFAERMRLARENKAAAKKGETDVPPPIISGESVAGTDTGGIEVTPSGEQAQGLDAAATDSTGVAGAESVSTAGDVREGEVAPALTPELWRERLENVKGDKPNSFPSIVNRINNLKTLLPTQAEEVERVNAAETIFGLIQEGIVSPKIFAERIGDKPELAKEITDDLVEAGIVAVTPKGLEIVNEKAFENFVEAESSALEQISTSLSKLIDIYDTPKMKTSTSLRNTVDKQLTKLESAIQERLEFKKLSKIKKAQKEGLESEALLDPNLESAGYATAQERIATKIGKEVASVTPEELEIAASSGNMGAVLDIVQARADTNFKSAKKDSPEANLAKVTNFLSKALNQLSPRDVRLQVEGKEGADPEVFARLKKELKLAEYDPKTRTVYVTKNGLSPKILLHEFVHAATVETLRKYETDPNSLTQEQREGVEHLKKTFELAKKRLGGKYRTAFENIYEFASYALSEPSFQRDMARFRVPTELVKYSKDWGKGVKTLWDNFTQAVARMVGLSPRSFVRYDKETKTLSATENFGGLESIQRDTVGNLLIETLGSLKSILAAPVEVEGVAPLPARKRGAKRTKLPADPDRTIEELTQDTLLNEANQEKRRAAIKGKEQFIWGRPLYDRLARIFQNDRRPTNTLEEMMREAGDLQYEGEGYNALNTALTLSSSKSYHNLMTPQIVEEGKPPASLKQSMDKVGRSVEAYAKARGIDIQKALAELNNMLIGLHEKERRFVKFLMNAPLSTSSKVKFGGIEDTPAGMRDRILKYLYQNTEKTADGKAKLTEDGTVAAMREALEGLVGYKNGVKVGPGHIDIVNGTRTNDTKPTAASADINSEEYIVIGVFAEKNIDVLRKEFEARTQNGEATAKPLKDLVAAMQEYQKTAKVFDKEANYWSVPVDNITALYGFKHYVPLKGFGGTEVSAGDERFEIGKRIGGEYTESTGAFGGRETPANNVVSQTLVDGTRSAMRAGRKNVTLALVNLMKEGIVKGKPVKTILFSERYKGITDLQKEKGPNKIFHYLPNGNIEIWEVRNKDILESVRRTYEASNPIVEYGNKVTGFIGHGHTRYNPAFYPYNFVRDALTNAFFVGIDTEPKKAFQYLGAVAANVAKFKFRKLHKVSRLYSEGRVEDIKKMAEKDPAVASVLEYLQEGGRVSYIQGLALEGQMETLQKQLGKDKFAPNAEVLNKWIDAWADMFEFASRSSAYQVMKADLMSKGVSEESARVQAASYAKNLANFEQIGQWGRGAGAFFMFFRPAATGAVRAIDALAPLFENEAAAVKRLPEKYRSDPQAMKTFRESRARKKAAAMTVLSSTAGMGATMYMMALMAADDDDQGRNEVQVDDLDLWTRNLRLPLSIIGKEGFLQVPWGFGIGAFAAAGAQVVGTATGNGSIPNMISNLFTIGLDSYLPLPISRINVMENPAAWLVDSLTPSAGRPLVQFVMNIDGLSRDIYNDRVTKYGEAYTGGKNVPQLYKDATDLLFRVTNGEVEIQPNSMYFFANNYVDGAMKIAQNAWGLGYTLAGTKDFDAKSDVVLISSFLGRQSNVDAREFAEVERKIEKHKSVLNAFEMQGNVEGMRRYLERYPNAYMMTKIYDRMKNGDLSKIREVKNAINSSKGFIDPETGKEVITIKDKKPYIDNLDLMQNRFKRKMIDGFNQYGL